MAHKPLLPSSAWHGIMTHLGSGIRRPSIETSGNGCHNERASKQQNTQSMSTMVGLDAKQAYLSRHNLVIETR
jgi:hypothetical protein